MIGVGVRDAIIIVAELLFMDTIVRELGTQFIRAGVMFLVMGHAINGT